MKDVAILQVFDVLLPHPRGRALCVCLPLEDSRTFVQLYVDVPQNLYTWLRNAWEMRIKIRHEILFYFLGEKVAKKKNRRRRSEKKKKLIKKNSAPDITYDTCMRFITIINLFFISSGMKLWPHDRMPTLFWWFWAFHFNETEKN